MINEEKIDFKTPGEAILYNKSKYILGSIDPIDSKGYHSIFSGSDVIAFFDNDMPETYSIKIEKTSMSCCFVLGKSSAKLIENKNWVDFYLIGVTENGNKGLISGECKAYNFQINTSIDELNIEMKVDFESRINSIKGWFGCSKEENEEISKIFWDLKNKYLEGLK